MSDRVDGLLAELTLEEKASLTAGVDMWHGHAVERLGIPALKVSDGPVGVRGDRWVGTTSACTPCGTALGATWDPELVEAVGRVLGEECRSKSVDVLLAPTVNLHRHPYAGRNFECFSEDPHLTARLAVAIVRGVQSTGVGACIKHFVANDSEFERHTISSDVGERVLRELYLVPFEAAVREADVAAVMSAYNRLNSTYCAEHRWLLVDLLKGEWGFEGLVMSDWWGTKSPQSAEGGLDLEMPGPPVHLGPGVAERVRSGELEESVLDDMVRRLLRTSERLGVLDLADRPAERSEDRPEHAEVLRRAARDAVVLLRNDPVDGAPVLPLDVGSLRRVAVIGPNADEPAVLGGGSAAVNPHHVTTVLDGLRAALGETVEVVHEPGVDASRTLPPIDSRRIRPAEAAQGEHGLTVEYFANRELSGTPAVVELARSPRLTWLGDESAPGVRTAEQSVRLRGTFVADVSGIHQFSLVTGGQGGRVLLDGEVLLDNFADQQPGTAFFGLGSAEIRARRHLEAGDELELVAELVGYDGLPAGALLVGHLPPVGNDGIERAAAAAADADVAVVVVGLNQDFETEGEDRTTLALPGEQDELLTSVIAANPRTVVLVNAGSPVDLWAAADAPALAQTWYLGQETGHAVADLLVGAHSPSGRLPMTYGAHVRDWPSHLNYPGEAGHVLYGEELFSGYRGFDERGIEPLFCFGHGLTYTTFDWAHAQLSSHTVSVAELAEGSLRVSVEVTNSGGRAGAEVVQCYVHDAATELRRPEQELRGFAKVHLEPNRTETVSIALDERAFAAWDPNESAWVVAPGVHEVRLGSSSRDLRGLLQLKVTA
jgi:beta-glucosidase